MIKTTNIPISMAIQPKYRPVISKSVGSTSSGDSIRKDSQKRNSSSAYKMETALITHRRIPKTQGSQCPLWVSSGPMVKSKIVEREGSICSAELSPLKIISVSIL